MRILHNIKLDKFGVPCQTVCWNHWTSPPFMKQVYARWYSNPFDKKIFFGLSPCPVTVTTRIVMFLGGDPELNLHLPLLLGGGTTQNILVKIWRIGVSKNRGTPKSSISIGFSMIFTIHFGVPLFLETPTSFHSSRFRLTLQGNDKTYPPSPSKRRFWSQWFFLQVGLGYGRTVPWRVGEPRKKPEPTFHWILDG